MIAPQFEPEWTSEDAIRLRTFLNTQTGGRFLERIVSRRPSFLEATAHPHKSFAQSRDIAGYERAIQEIVSMTRPEEKPPEDPSRENLPDLDDEKAWEEIEAQKRKS